MYGVSLEVCSGGRCTNAARWTAFEPLRGWDSTTYNTLLGGASLHGLFASCALQYTPRQTLHPEPPALSSSQGLREEGLFYLYARTFGLYGLGMYRSPCQRS